MALPCPPLPSPTPQNSSLMAPPKFQTKGGYQFDKLEPPVLVPVSTNLGFCSGLQNCPFQLNQIINLSSI